MTDLVLDLTLDSDIDTDNDVTLYRSSSDETYCENSSITEVTWNSATNTASMGVISDGTYYLSFYAVDTVGNTTCSNTISYTYDGTAPTPILAIEGTSLTDIKSYISELTFVATNSTDSDIASTELLVSHDGTGVCDGSFSEVTYVGDPPGTDAEMEITADLSGTVDGNAFEKDTSKACFKLRQTDTNGNVGESSQFSLTYVSPVSEYEILSATHDVADTAGSTSCSTSSKSFTRSADNNCSGDSTVPNFEVTLVTGGYINSSYSWWVFDNSGLYTAGEELSSLDVYDSNSSSKPTFSFYNNFQSPGDSMELGIAEFDGVAVSSVTYTVNQPEGVLEASATADSSSNDGNQADCESAGYKYNTSDNTCTPYAIAQHLSDQMCSTDATCMIVDTSNLESTSNSSVEDYENSTAHGPEQRNLLFIKKYKRSIRI